MRIKWTSPLAGAFFVGGGFIAISIILFWIGFSQRSFENSISGWPSVEGKLLSAEVTQDYVSSRGPRLRWMPKVNFSYIVDGKTYEGTRLFWGRDNSTDRALVESWLVRTLGQSFEASSPRPQTVYYDPLDPAMALLDNRNYSGSSYGALTVGAFFLLAGSCIAAMFIRKSR